MTVVFNYQILYIFYYIIFYIWETFHMIQNHQMEFPMILDSMKYILENGIERDDRTGTGTISSFGHQLKFNLRDTFPLSTTKRMFFRAIFEDFQCNIRSSRCFTNWCFIYFTKYL